MEITSPKRKRVESGKVKRKHAVSVKYQIRKKDGHMLPVCAATFQVYPECPRINSLIWPTHFMLQEDHVLKNEEGTGVLLKIKKSHKLLRRITSKHINVESATMPETSPEEDTYHKS
ncbi:hypothetical protein C0J52_13098 [Blattella germanica]|nr:hypothetical protein C0J52_13098 [Blattella germanica]